MRKTTVVIGILLLAVSVGGCAVVGMPTLAPQSGDGYRAKAFDKDLAYCRDNTLAALKAWQAQVIKEAGTSYIIAINFEGVYKNCIDTTEVDIFFKEMGPNRTEVGVSSLNYDLAQFAAENLFAYIDNPKAPTCKYEPVKVHREYERKKGIHS